MPGGYRFGGSKDDFERFRNAGGGPGGPIAGGRSARRVPIAGAQGPASTGNRALDATLMLQAGNRRFAAGQSALDREKEMAKQRLANQGAYDVQGLSNQGDMEKQGLVSRTSIQTEGMDQAGQNFRNQNTIAGQLRVNRENNAAQNYNMFGGGDRAEAISRGEYASAGDVNVRDYDKANWQLGQVTGPDGNPRDVFYNQSGGGDIFEANTQLGISNLGRGRPGSASELAGPGDTLLNETDYTNMENARNAVGGNPGAPAQQPTVQQPITKKTRSQRTGTNGSYGAEGYEPDVRKRAYLNEKFRRLMGMPIRTNESGF